MNRGFQICKEYQSRNINLPKRQTKNSVGYDIESAEDIIIKPVFDVNSNEYNKPTLVKTGVKAYFCDDEVMYLYNRSSGPLKRGLVLANSVGVFESDYYGNPSNDGEILVCFYNFTAKDILIKKGEKIAQCVFQKFLIVDNDYAEGIRQGGFGSTNK